MTGHTKIISKFSKVIFVMFAIAVMLISALSPINVHAAGQSISVTLDSDYKNYQTFTSLVDGTSSPKMTIKLSVNVDGDGSVVNGGKIIIPLDYAPMDNTKYANFDYTPNHNPTRDPSQIEDFFVYDKITTDTELINASVTDFVHDISIVGNDLVITLKDGLSDGLREFYLYFDFNTGYSSKIPSATTLWEVKPETFIGALPSTAVTSIAITSGAVTDGVSMVHELRDPSIVDTISGKVNYELGPIVLRLRFRNNYDYQTTIDMTEQPYLYIDIPNNVTYSGTDFTIIPGAGTAAPGYTRYAYALTSDTDWKQYRYNGNSNSTFSLYNTEYLIPALTIGDEISITSGIVIKKVNGSVQRVETTTTYVKTDSLPWNMSITSTHNTTDTSTGGTTVITDGDGSETVRTVYAFGFTSYSALDTTKNLGAQDITGVKWVLEQPASGSEKVAFASIAIVPSRMDTTINEMKYNVSLEIVDTKGTVDTSDDTTRTFVYGGASSPTVFTGVQTLDISDATLSLIVGEYINKVIVVPRGNGATPSPEGTWPHHTGFAIGYVAKKWDSGTWPDGSSIADYTTVSTRHYMEYDNDNNPSDHIITPYFDSRQPIIFIKNGMSVASVVIAANDVSVAPGAVTNFEIVGRADQNYSPFGWYKPKIMMRVPKALTLEGNTFTLVDADGRTASVSGFLVSSDANYNYYSFVTTDEYTSSVQRGTAVAFTISVPFRVAPGTPAGDLEINRVLISTATSANFKQAYHATQNIPIGEILTLSNYGLGTSDVYSASTSSTKIRVQTLSNISPAVSIKVDGVHANFITLADGDVFPAANGSNVQVKLTLTNDGNTTFTDLRIYDLLPPTFASSTGSIEFVGITGSGSVTAYYTDVATPITLATMEPNTYDPTTNTAMWKTSIAALSGDPTAMFLKVGGDIAPGQSVEIIMNFEIPATGEQTAYTQFEFSAAEKTQGSVVKKMSGAVGFSTEAISIVYDGNIASVGYTRSGDVVASLPAISTGIYNIDTLTVTTDTPTLYGYNFIGWNDKADGTGTAYAANANVTIYTATEKELTLYAQWEAKNVVVTYSADGSTHDTKTYAYGTTLAAGNLPSAPTKTGYSFNGWGTSSTGSTVNFGAGTRINFEATTAVYAKFTIIDYNVNIATGIVGGTVTADKATANMGDTVTLTVTPATGYVVDTITVTKAGGGTVSVSASKTFTMPADAVTVNVVFARAEFDVTIGTGISNGTVTADKSKAYENDVVTLTVTPAVGYEVTTLTVTKAGGGTVTVSGTNTFTMPADDVTVTATFALAEYTIVVNPTTNGVITLSTYTSEMDEQIGITITPDYGYELDDITITTTGIVRAIVPFNAAVDTTFKMPAGNVVINATFKRSLHTVTVVTVGHGSASVDYSTASIGDVINISTSANSGHELFRIEVKDSSGNVLPRTAGIFTMPGENVTVTVTFMAKPVGPVIPSTGVDGSLLPWTGLMVLSASAMALLRKKKKEEE